MANFTSRGQQRDKPFRDALRMELAAAGEDHKALRSIARNLITLASKEDPQAMAAIREIADRMDGKPIQSVEVGEPGEFDRLSDAELIAEMTETAAVIGVAVPKRKGNGRSNGTTH